LGYVIHAKPSSNFLTNFVNFPFPQGFSLQEMVVEAAQPIFIPSSPESPSDRNLTFLGNFSPTIEPNRRENPSTLKEISLELVQMPEMAFGE
jgi:hypothetical protein